MAEIAEPVSGGVHSCERRKTMAEWPSDFPLQCPPEDAVDSNATFFRLVSASPPNESDFWSHKARVDAGLDRPRTGRVDECLAVGVSVFDEAESALTMKAAVPALRDRHIAAGSMDGSGVVKRTGKTDGHHTWWRPSGDLAWQGFEVQP